MYFNFNMLLRNLYLKFPSKRSTQWRESGVSDEGTLRKIQSSEKKSILRLWHQIYKEKHLNFFLFDSISNWTHGQSVFYKVAF